ncbi:MAG: cupredoxin family copper-binding protein, partial [Marmoricola sp.]
MSSQKNRVSTPMVGASLRQRVLGLGAVGGLLAGVAAVVAMSSAVGGAVLLTNTASTSAAAPAAHSVAKAAPARTAAATTVVAATKSVMIENYAFSPAALTVKVGDTVSWTNMDEAPHTVTVSSGPVKFASPTLQKGQSFTYTFTKAGTYSYYCAVHPDMKATVDVTGSSTSPTPGTPTPTPGHSGHGGTPAPDACGGAEASLDAFLAHLYAGHLETSVGQQVKDASNVDQYVKTHTVLIENMLKPLVGGGQASLDAFLAHLYAGHLETSVGQQVKDASNVDQYVKTHTVLIENMLKPLVGGGQAS